MLDNGKKDMTAINQEDNVQILEKTINILCQEKGNQQKSIEELKLLMDLKLTDSQREVQDKNFLMDLKMFRTRQEFTKFMQSIRAKIDQQIKDYYTLQALYELQKTEIKDLTIKVVAADKITNCLRENRIFYEFPDYLKQCKDMEHINSALKEESNVLRIDIQEHKNLTEQLKDINQREKQLYKLQIEGLEQEKQILLEKRNEGLNDLMRLQQSRNQEEQDNIMIEIFKANEQEIKQLIFEQQEMEKKEEEEKQKELLQLQQVKAEDEKKKQNAKSKSSYFQTQKQRLEQKKLGNKIQREVNRSLSKSQSKKIFEDRESFQNIHGFSETAEEIKQKNVRDNVALMKKSKYLNKSNSKKSISPSKDNTMMNNSTFLNNTQNNNHNTNLTKQFEQNPSKNQSQIYNTNPLFDTNNKNEILFNESQLVVDNNPNSGGDKNNQSKTINQKSKVCKNVTSFKYDYSKKKNGYFDRK